MDPRPLPVLGPGSQPDEPFPTLALPTAMTTFERPSLPEGVSGTAEARAVLLPFLAALRAWRAGVGPPPRVALDDRSAAARAALTQVLGEGEVTAVITRPAERVHVQETAFAGVWRVRTVGRDGAACGDALEAGPIPAELRAARAGAPRRVPIPPEPAGLMNSPAVLREVLARAAERRPGDAAHVVNLTLLPMTPEDLAYLHDALGTGPVAIHTRGYGSCRITSSALADVWWVQYFNAMNALILDTLEVVDMPDAALAAGEDLDATATRLAEWLTDLAEA